MKLITHNMLTSRCIRGVNVGFPLGIQATEVKETKVDFNPEFMAKMIPKLDWDALCKAAENLGKSDLVPPSIIPNFEGNEEFLKKAHHILLELEVVNGDLICPETGRKFPITEGIPKMLINEDEV